MRRAPTAHVYYTMTRGLCATCREPVDAKVWIRDGAAHLSKFCPIHGHEEVEIASSASWYLQSLAFIAPSAPPLRTRPVGRGCPRDCGPCELHQQATRLAIVDASAAAPELLRRLRAEDPTLTSVELRGAETGDALVEAARTAGFSEVRRRMGSAGSATTISVSTSTGSVERLEVTVDARTSASDLGAHLAALCHRPTLTTLELIPWSAPGHPRFTIPTLQRLIAEVSPLTPDDFVPSPFAHPHCFAIALASVSPASGDGQLVPLARTLGREGLFQMLARPEPLAHGVKTIALHALMHADDFDIARVMSCPIAHATPTESVPVCARRALAPPGADS